MDEMITVYLYGKKYTVPSSLTIMEAFEYSGYQLVRGWGCRQRVFWGCTAVTVSVVLVLLFTVLRVRQLFMAAWHVPQRLRTTCV